VDAARLQRVRRVTQVPAKRARSAHRRARKPALSK